MQTLSFSVLTSSLFILFLKKSLDEKKIALLASGKGSNAKNISTFFKGSKNISVELFVQTIQLVLFLILVKKTTYHLI